MESVKKPATNKMKHKTASVFQIFFSSFNLTCCNKLNIYKFYWD